MAPEDAPHNYKRHTNAARSLARPPMCKYNLTRLTLTILITYLALSLQANCQRYEKATKSNCNHQRQAARQQRQYTQRNAPLTKGLELPQQQAAPQLQVQAAASQHAQQHQQQGPGDQLSAESSLEAQQEEFSLALGSPQGQQVSNYTLLMPASNEQQQTAAGNQSGPAVHTQEQQPDIGADQAILNTTPAIPSDSIGSPVALQPPATTTSSIPASATASKPPTLSPASQSSTTEVQNATLLATGAGSAGSVATTTSAPANAAQQPLVGNGGLISKEQQQQQYTRAPLQATGRRMEDDLARHMPSQQQHHQTLEQFQGRHDNLYGHAHSAAQQQQYHSADQQQVAGHTGSNLGQPVSSSPSSITIITPLIGPLAQAQAHTTSVSASIGGGQAQTSDNSQQAMMKPIFVVGSPISERDYSNSLYYNQYSQPKQEASYQHQFPQAQQAQQPEQPEQQVAAVSNGDSQQQPVKVSKGSEQSVQQLDGAQAGSQHGLSVQHAPQKGSMQPKLIETPAPYPTAPPTHLAPSPRLDKSTEDLQLAAAGGEISQLGNATSSYSQMGDRISGPPLVYSDGRLSSVQVEPNNVALQPQPQPQQPNVNGTLGVQVQQQAQAQQQPPPSPRLYQSSSTGSGAAVVGNNPRRPSLPPPVNQANAASGFRSPMSPSGPLVGTASQQTLQQQQQQAALSSLQPPLNSLSSSSTSAANFYQSSPPYAGPNLISMSGMNSIYNAPPVSPQPIMSYNKPASNFMLSSAPAPGAQSQHQREQTTQALTIPQSQVMPTPLPGPMPGSGRRPLNITRVEHISAECSNDLIRAVIVFNGTFKGIIYSSGYVNDPTCLYVNGTGSTRYEFNIRLNQCGTLGRQELHQPTIPGEARRRDQVMWNTLSIQYNSIIEQEWDEHFKVSCEYGSDFWKTVSFSPFNVETNTGSPVVFTINPPQCQMDVLLGHGMGPKIVDGPVTVGDPLTLLIHMKSEKAGYDILVKNCAAHNGGKQRMQLIDSNGCVVNERFISPFRGTYNDNDLRHVTLYAYLKAFRFTGSPVLYLECEIHMCQSACPPQMCYWRRLSKRSVDEFEYTANNSLTSARTGSSSSGNDDGANEDQPPIISDSLNLYKALQVRQGSEPIKAQREMRQIYAEDDEAALICYRHAEVFIFLATMASLLALIITVAVTCWFRIRKLTRSQYDHSSLKTSGSLSPSLLSISDAISSAGSIISNATAAAATRGSLLSLNSKANCRQASTSPGWFLQQQQNHHAQQQQYHNNCAPKAHMQPHKPSLHPSITSFHGRTQAAYPPRSAR